MKPPGAANKWVPIHLASEVIVYLPAFIRHKHYSEDEVNKTLEDFASKLGGDFHYLEEIESND